MTSTTFDQFEILVDFMETNEGIAKNFLNALQFRDSTNNLWNEVKDRLNSAGPPQRSVDGWKKVWRDFKYHTKSKLRANKKSVSGTGGGPCRIKRLSNLEERVNVLLDMGTEIEGINAQSFGCRVESNEILVTNQVPSASPTPVIENEEPIIVPRTRKEPKETMKTLLKKQLQLQEDHNKNQERQSNQLIKTLKDIRHTQDKKLSFEKEKWKAKKVILLDKLKLKVQFLELKGRELDLRQQELEATK